MVEYLHETRELITKSIPESTEKPNMTQLGNKFGIAKRYAQRVGASEVDLHRVFVTGRIPRLKWWCFKGFF